MLLSLRVLPLAGMLRRPVGWPVGWPVKRPVRGGLTGSLGDLIGVDVGDAGDSELVGHGERKRRRRVEWKETKDKGKKEGDERKKEVR